MQAWETTHHQLHEFCEPVAVIYSMGMHAGKLTLSTIQEKKTILHVFHVQQTYMYKMHQENF
jgi:hypothetical protein